MVYQTLVYLSLFALAHSNIALYFKDKQVEEKNNEDNDNVADISISWMVVSTKHLQRPKCFHDKKFLSFTIDIIEMMRKFQCVPLHGPKFNRLVAGLSPAYLRVGGTPQDFLTFDFSSKEFDDSFTKLSQRDCSPHFQSWREIKDFQLPIYYFDEIARFADSNKLNLIFGLNGRKKTDNGQWDFDQVLQIVSHAKEQKYKNLNWQIGNEPYRYRKYGPNDSVTPQELSSHFHQLNTLLPKTTLTGPDITRLKRKSLVFFLSFLRAKPDIHAITYHHYFMHENESTREKYLDVSYLDKLDYQMHTIKQLVRDTNPNYDIWMGESGSSSGGGKKGLSDSFIAGFHYLAAIGLSSVHCHKVFIRQSFYGGYYGMLDPITYGPLPDYWTTYIFKKLVGNIYLNEFYTRQKDVRVHAYCAKNSSDDITFVYINYRPTDVLLLLDRFQQFQLEIFSLTPGDGDVLSKKVLLNDKLLSLDSRGEIPEIKGRPTDEPVSLASFSYGFIIVKNIGVEACKT